MYAKSRSLNAAISSNLVGSGLLMVLLIAGCMPVKAPATSAVVAPRVYFTNIEEGATVTSPVKLTMGAEGFTVEPAGEVNANAGHLHIMVDAPCVEPGQGIPKDEAHLHYGQGQIEAELELAAGRHTLCLQAADGAHVALAGDGMAQIVTINVE